MTPKPHNYAPLLDFAQKLMDVGVGIIAGSKVEIGQEWARNPKVIALTLLSRSLGNLKDAISMVHQNLVVEARSLTRLACENLICLGGLAANGTEFVKNLVEDEALSRKKKGKLLRDHAESQDLGEITDKLRAYVEEIERKYPKPKKLDMRRTAEASAVRQAYVWYTMLSGDALHASATSLNRHLFREFEGDTVYLRVDVAPEPRPEEMYETAEILCAVVLGVCVASNDVLGGTPVGVVLRSMADELDLLKAAHAPEGLPKAS
jgi:Family of unknown function (DUF5677)